MNTEFEKYLDDIDVAKGVKDRINEIISFYVDVLKISIEDILLTDYITEDKGRIFENLLLFNSNDIMEAKQFLHQDDFDCFKFSKNIYSWTIIKSNYDFINLNEKSRVNIEFRYKNVEGYCNIKGSFKNCEYIKRIFMKHIITNKI